MNNNNKIARMLALAALVCVLALTLAACGNSGAPAPAADGGGASAPPVDSGSAGYDSESLDEETAFPDWTIMGVPGSLMVGEETDLWLEGGDAADWNSSDDSVATIDASGHLVAVGAGHAEIYVLDSYSRSDYLVLEVLSDSAPAQTPVSEPSNSGNSDYTGAFAIEGKWKQTGEGTYGQAQAGAIIVFDGTHCNFVSPQDTYAFYEVEGNYRLDVTTWLFADSLSYSVTIVDKDQVIITGVTLTRLS